MHIYNKNKRSEKNESVKALEQSDQQVENKVKHETQAVQDDEAYENEENRIANQEQMEDMMMMGEDDDFVIWMAMKVIN